MKTLSFLPLISIFSFLSILFGIPAAAAQSFIGGRVQSATGSRIIHASQSDKPSPPVQNIKSQGSAPLPAMELRLQTPYSYNKDHIIALKFNQELVGNEQVGKDVDPSIWASAPDFAYEAYWANTSEIALILTKNFSFRQKVHFVLKPELRSLKGHSLPKANLRHSIQTGPRITNQDLNTPYHTPANQAIILGSVDADISVLLKNNIDQARFLISPSDREQNGRYLPAPSRPLRLEDILGSEDRSEQYRVLFNDWEQLKKSLLAQQNPQDGQASQPPVLDPKSIIPGFWYIYPCLELRNRERLTVSIPQMGDVYISSKDGWDSEEFSNQQLPSPQLQVISRRPEDKLGHSYLIELKLSIPLAATQLESSLSKLQWQLNKSHLKPEEECTRLSYEPNSKSYRAEIEGKTYELLLDKVASKTRIIQQLKHGKEIAIEVYDSLHFIIQTHEQPLRLSCQAELELINGEKTAFFVPRVIPAPKIPSHTPAAQVERLLNAHKLAQKQADKLPERYQTKLLTRRPYLSSAASLSNIMQQGSQSVPCSYRNLKNVRARITRIDASPQNAAKAIALYNASEKSAKPLSEDASAEEQTKWAELVRKSPLAGHPAIISLSEIALPDGNQNFRINLREGKIQHHDKPASASAASTTPPASDASAIPSSDSPVLYLLEITGTASDNWRAAHPEHKHAQFYNRGLIQSSNLGLMWKTSNKKIYLYPYQLSDAKAPAKVQADFLDAEGRKLASHDITSEGQNFPLDEKLAYISLHQDNDYYTLDINQEKALRSSQYWMDRIFDSLDIDLNKLPITSCFIFTEREEYRAGEDVYIKGIIRSRIGNQLTAPNDIEKVTLRIGKYGKGITIDNIAIQADGSFSYRHRLPEDAHGYHQVHSSIKFKGDSDKSSQDMQILFANLPKEEPYKNSTKKLSAKERREIYTYRNVKWRIQTRINSNRQAKCSFIVEEFRRPEFELQIKASINDEQNQITLHNQAQQYTGVPLNKGRSTWVITARPSYYSIPHYEGYTIREHESYIRGISLEVKSELDSEGKSKLTIPIPKLAEACFMDIRLENTVTNEQGKSRRKTILIESKPADIAIGIKNKRYSSSYPRDKSLYVQLLSIDRDDKPCLLPSPMKISVIRSSYHCSLQGLIKGHQIRNYKVDELVYEQELLPSKPDSSIEIPLTKEGTYSIRISGKDAKNRPYLSTQWHTVYGNVPTWGRQPGNALILRPDKESYRAGDVARITVESPVAAEIICSIEREDILRHSRHSISPKNPIIEIPIEEGDAPMIHISAFLLESRKGKKHYAQLPILKMGNASLRIESEKQKLSIELHKNKESLRPQDELKIRGQVRDYQGKAVPKAHITFYAVDEGILTLTGKADAPDLLSFFNANRPQLVKSYSSLNQTLGDSLKRRQYGNKGTFIGGGMNRENLSAKFAIEEEKALERVMKNMLREDFRPVAYWLGYQQCDAQGQFEIQYKNPDTLTRYRIIALANDGKDRFGKLESDYEIVKSIMLEVNAPEIVVQGDKINVPLSVTLRLDKLKNIEAKDIKWSIRAEASKGISIPTEARVIHLSDAGPHKLSIPIEIDAATLGAATIIWNIEGHLSDGTLLPYSDSILSKLDIRSALPLLRENILLALPTGKDIALLDSIKGRYLDPIELKLKLSPSPLIGINKHIKRIIAPSYSDYKASISRCIPYIIADELIRYTGLPAATLVEGRPAIPFLVDEGSRQQSPPNLGDMLKRLTSRQENGIIRYTAWRKSSPSISNAYALLILQLAQDKGKLPADLAWALEMGYDKIKEASKLSKADGNKFSKEEHRAATVPLALYCLARANQLSPAEFDFFLAQQKKGQGEHYISGQYCYLIALVARLIEHPQADAFLQTAIESIDRYKYSSGHKNQLSYEELPSLPVLQMLEHIARAPQDPELLAKLLIVLREDEGDPNPNERQTAWTYLLLERYIHATSIAQGKASLKGGKEASNSQALLEEITSMTALADKRYLVEQGSLYAIGALEGFCSPPPTSKSASLEPVACNKPLSNGLIISRSYKRGLPNGRWEALSKPQVGDIIRIQLKVRRQKYSSFARCASITDYLPACMESINPKVLEQSSSRPNEYSLEQQISTYSDAKLYSTHGAQFIQRYELSSEEDSSFTYHARVTKSGSVIAPAAKAELLYQPSIYGLSAPQHFDIKDKTATK